MLRDTTWTMALAKRDFGLGLLAKFGIVRSVPAGGWNVLLSGAGGYGMLVDARTKQPRLFKTCDACIAALEQVGFRVDGFVSGVL